MTNDEQSSLNVPASLIRDVRRALYAFLDDAAKQVSATGRRPEHELHPEWFAAADDHLVRGFALLDELGHDDGPCDTEIMPEHGRTLLEVLDQVALLLTDWMAVHDDQDPEWNDHRDRYQLLLRVEAEVRRDATW